MLQGLCHSYQTFGPSRAFMYKMYDQIVCIAYALAYSPTAWETYSGRCLKNSKAHRQLAGISKITALVWVRLKFSPTLFRISLCPNIFELPRFFLCRFLVLHEVLLWPRLYAAVTGHHVNFCLALFCQLKRVNKRFAGLPLGLLASCMWARHVLPESRCLQLHLENDPRDSVSDGSGATNLRAYGLDVSQSSRQETKAGLQSCRSPLLAPDRGQST